MPPNQMHFRDEVEQNAYLAYIHKICRQSDLMYCYTQDDVEGMSPLEVENMLLYAGAEKKIKQKLKGEWKYRRLQDYFEKKRGKEFSLTFAKLEKISKHPISETMRKDRNRWYRRKGVNTMPDAWEEEGFYIEKLDLEKEIVVFKRRVMGKAKLEVPKVLLEEEINVHVKEEIEHYLRWIVQAKGIGKGVTVQR